MNVENQLLVGAGVSRRLSPNVGGAFEPPNPDTIVIHYTDGDSVEAAVNTLCDPARKVSAHLVVGRAGELVQLVPFDTVAWHAGESRWGDRQQFNHFSLGVEVQNAGKLEEHSGRFLSSLGIEYPPEEVYAAVHRNQVESAFWHRFPALQLEVVERVCGLLVASFGIDHILGHEEIAPGRKIDPGPAFPLDQLRHRLLYRAAPGPPT